MYLALQQRKDAGKTDIDIPCEATVRKVMVQIGLIHKPRRKPNGITKADRLARKSDDLLRRDFYADRPLKKAVTDISEVKAKDGRLYVSVIFDCFDLMPLGIAIEDNMRASLCCHTLENANKSYPDIKGCIIHSDRGSIIKLDKLQSKAHKESPSAYHRGIFIYVRKITLSLLQLRQRSSLPSSLRLRLSRNEHTQQRRSYRQAS